MPFLTLVWLYDFCNHEMHLKIVSAFVHHSVRRMGFMAKPVGGSGAGPCALPHTSLAHILGLEEESEGAADPDHNAAIRCAKIQLLGYIVERKIAFTPSFCLLMMIIDCTFSVVLLSLLIDIYILLLGAKRPRQNVLSALYNSELAQCLLLLETLVKRRG